MNAKEMGIKVEMDGPVTTETIVAYYWSRSKAYMINSYIVPGCTDENVVAIFKVKPKNQKP